MSSGALIATVITSIYTSTNVKLVMIFKIFNYMIYVTYHICTYKKYVYIYIYLIHLGSATCCFLRVLTLRRSAYGEVRRAAYAFEAGFK